MTSLIHTECIKHLESERTMCTAEHQLLRHQLENKQRALQVTRENAGMASWQLRGQIVALKSELPPTFILAHVRQFIPGVYVELPRTLLTKSPSSLSSNTSGSLVASTQSTIMTIAPVASARLYS